MNLLLIAASYPHAAAEWAGAMNEHSALALRKHVGHLVVLTPTPYAPKFLALRARWRAYALAPKREVRSGITVYRPGYPVMPRILQGFWPSTGSYLSSRWLARRLDRALAFDAILSFDLAFAGGLAWRLARNLGIPSCGWATGSDVRWNSRSSIGRSVRTTLQQLDLTFYQSGELKDLGSKLLADHGTVALKDRHVVQARGVRAPETFGAETRRREIRATLAIPDDHIVVLYVGRIVRDKGIFDLVEEFARWRRTHQDVWFVFLGSRPGHDETAEFQDRIARLPGLDGRIRILPGCSPARIWDYFATADIFAFPSFREGMPNSLLEAMMAGLPSVAFGIPPVQEICRFGDGLIHVPAFDFVSFGDALRRLIAEPSLRRTMGDRGRQLARQHFSIEASMHAAVRHIEQLLGEGAQRDRRRCSDKQGEARRRWPRGF